MDYTPEEVAKKIVSLPEDLKEIIFDSSIGEKMQAIGKKYGLHVNETSSLMDEAYWVMIGLTHPDQFTNRLKETLQLPDEKIKAITSDISEDIIGDIRGQLQKLHGEKPDEEEITDEEIDKLLAEPIESGTTKNILEKSGVEVVENKPLDMGSFGNVTVSAIDKNLEKSGVQVVPEKKEEAESPIPFHLNRDMILKGVENPQKIASPITSPSEELKKGIVGEKLAGTFKISKEEKEYSFKKPDISGAATSEEPILRHKDRVDPYRETIT